MPRFPKTSKRIASLPLLNPTPARWVRICWRCHLILQWHRKDVMPMTLPVLLVLYRNCKTINKLRANQSRSQPRDLVQNGADPCQSIILCMTMSVLCWRSNIAQLTPNYPRQRPKAATRTAVGNESATLRMPSHRHITSLRFTLSLEVPVAPACGQESSTKGYAMLLQ